MRCFVAVLPPEQVLEQLAGHLAPRRDADADDFRWTRHEHLHLTLAFVAELPDWRVEELCSAMDRWAERQSPLRLRLSGAGAFPDPARARVLWVGVAGEQEAGHLAAWAGQLRDLASHHGGAVDAQRFVPHVTVARSGRPRTAGRVVQALDGFASSTFEVDSVALVQSFLGEGPHRTPRYDVLHHAVLGPAAPGA